MKIVTILAVFLATAFDLNSQYKIEKNFYHDFGFNKDSNDNYDNRFSIGIGLRKAIPTKSDININDRTYFVITSMFLLHIRKPLFIYTGLDIYKANWNTLGLNAYVIPAYDLVVHKNAFNMILGAGGTVELAIGNNSGVLLGFAFVARPEYRIKEKYSIGLELKHVNFLQESSGKFILIGSIDFAVFY